MKIQTNAGEVELTAEMVVRGMVFRVPAWAGFIESGVVALQAHDGREWWVTDSGCRCNVLAMGVKAAFLGCDPAYATRADCERFGVHGDAAAHGFARLKSGGAVDLREHGVAGAVVCVPEDRTDRYTIRSAHSRIGPRGIFVGLRADVASPADVERLCCGAVFHDEHGGCGERCTLAIGNHDKHEDLATGVKWPAKAKREPMPGVWVAEFDRGRMRDTGHGWGTLPMPPCAKCGGSAGHIMNAVSVALADASRGDGWRAHASVCMTCAGIVGAKPNAYEIRDGRIMEKRAPPPAYFLHADFRTFLVTAKQRGNTWEVCGNDLAMHDALRGHSGAVTLARGGESRRMFAVNVSTKMLATCEQIVTAVLADEGTVVFGVDYAAGPSTSAVRKAESEPTGRVCPGCKAEERRQKVGAVASTMLHKSGCRVVQEAPLLALVAAVPEGLNPIGWRAAVLAVDEMCKVQGCAVPIQWRLAERQIRDRETDTVAFYAYQRAIAPHKAPPPERKRGRGLPIDDGGHYE